MCICRKTFVPKEIERGWWVKKKRAFRTTYAYQTEQKKMHTHTHTRTARTTEMTMIKWVSTFILSFSCRTRRCLHFWNATLKRIKIVYDSQRRKILQFYKKQRMDVYEVCALWVRNMLQMQHVANGDNKHITSSRVYMQHELYGPLTTTFTLRFVPFK